MKKQEDKQGVKLTGKQEAFCREYVIDWNAMQAAIRAGYSEKTAKIIGCQNLTKLNIKERIDHWKAHTEELTGISKNKVINEYAKLAFSSIAHLHNTWIDKKEFEDLTNDQKECIQEIETRVQRREFEEAVIMVEQVKVKLYSKQAALDSICKVMGYNASIKAEVTGKDGADLVPRPIIVASEDVKKDLEELLKNG